MIRVFVILVIIVVVAILVIQFVFPLLPDQWRGIIGVVFTIIVFLAALAEITGFDLRSILEGRRRRARINVRQIGHVLSTDGYHAIPVAPLKFVINLDIRNSGPVEGRLTLRVVSVVFDSGCLTIDPETASVQLFVAGIAKPFPYRVPAEHSVYNARCGVQLRTATFSTLMEWVRFLEAPGGYVLTMQHEVEQLDGKSETKSLVIEGGMQEMRRHVLNKWQTRLRHTRSDQEKLELARAIESVARATTPPEE